MSIGLVKKQTRIHILYIFTFIVVISLLIGYLFFNKKPATAVDARNFQAGRIIDDSIFIKNQSMTASQIQDFFNQKNSVCLKNFTGPSLIDDNGDGVVSDTTSEPYGPEVMSAAQIIKAASDIYMINPQVLLVMLQKEQGLISGSNCSNMDTALGYGCPDTPAGCSDLAKGFTRQIDYGAYHLRGYFDDSLNSVPFTTGNHQIYYNPGPYNNATESFYGRFETRRDVEYCGSSIVNIQNRATAALYSYTPYQPNTASIAAQYGSAEPCGAYGNRNFYLYFNDYFGQSTIGAQPSPLYQSESTSMIYVVWGQTKYHVSSYDTLIAWGLRKYSIATSSDSYLNQLNTGKSLTTIVKKSDDSSSPFFLLDDGKRYPIPIDACVKDLNGQTQPSTSWGLDCFNSQTSGSMPGAFIDSFTVQDISLPNMIAYDNSVWKMENGKKRRIVDPYVIEVLGGWGVVRWMKDLNAQQPLGSILMRNGYLVKFTGNDIIYWYDNNQLIPIESTDMMKNWKFDSIQLHEFPLGYQLTSPLPVGSPITRLVKDSNGNMFIVDKGFKMPLLSESVSWPNTNTTILAGLNHLTTIPLSNVFRSDSGLIFTVSNSRKYIFPTMSDFQGLGFKTTAIRQVSTTIENITGLSYGGMHLATGRLYKISGDKNQIYRINGSTSQYVNSINYPDLPYEGLIIIDPITASRYPVIGTYIP